MAGPPVPNMQPRTFMGQPVTGVGMTDRGPLPRSFWEATASEFDFRGDQMVERWRMLGEPRGEPMLPEEFQELAGDREIPFEPGITKDEAERRVMFYDYEQWESRMQGRPIASLLGGFGPALLDPASVVTMPVGGVNFARAALTPTLGKFLGQMALGGAKAGVAVAPFEVAYQRAETGTIRPGELAGAVIGPILLAPALGAAGRGLRRLFGANGHEVNRTVRNLATDGTRDPVEAVRIINEASREGLPPPPRSQRTAPRPATPVRRLQETFADYRGGHRQFVRDLAAGRAEAQTKLEALGVRADDPAIERMIDRLARASDQRSSTPTDYNLRLLDTFNLARAGEVLDPAQRQILTENGLARPAAAGVEGDAPIELTNTGTRLAEALDAPREVRNAKLLRKVNTQGAGAVRNDLEAAATKGTGDLPDPGPRVIDDDWDDAELIRALETARRPAPDLRKLDDNAVDPQRVEPPPEGERSQPLRETPEEAAQRQWAVQQGVDMESINAAVKEAAERALACGR
jgi:hypothetical protein